MNSPDMPDFMTVQEVAGVLKCTDQYVTKLIRTAELPAFPLGRHYRVDRADLNRYIREKKLKKGAGSRLRQYRNQPPTQKRTQKEEANNGR